MSDPFSSESNPEFGSPPTSPPPTQPPSAPPAQGQAQPPVQPPGQQGAGVPSTPPGPSPFSGPGGQPTPGVGTGAMPPGQPSPGQVPGGYRPQAQIPPGQVPPGHVPPGGQIPPGPPGTYGAYGAPGVQPPKAYSATPWLILAAVLALFTIGGTAGLWWLTKTWRQAPVIDFNEDTVAEYSEYATDEPGLDANPSASTSASPAEPGVPTDAKPTAAGTTAHPNGVQGQAYDPSFESPDKLTPGTSSPIGVGEQKEGSSKADTYDTFVVDLQADQKVTIDIKSKGFNDYRVWVIDSAGTVVGFQDDNPEKSDSLDPTLVFTAPQAGQYHIRVFNAITIGESPFTISVNE